VLYRVFLASGVAALLFNGAIFGFFYAFFASVLNGFDTMPPDAAIEAMNAINREVRNVRFFPIFFLTPLMALIAAGLGWAAGQRGAALFFAAACLVYVGGGIFPTVQMSVPLNQVLMTVDTTVLSPGELADAWSAYSYDWSWWNALRSVFSGVALALCGGGLWMAARRGS